jgi:protein-tyrosine phosphatase
MLFISDAISARDLKQIYDHEIRAVVDLAANERPAGLGRDLIYCRFPLSDGHTNDDAMLECSILCLESLLNRHFRTLVACSAGMSRSPLIAAAAVSLQTGDSLADCLARITADAPHDVSPSLLSSVNRVHAKLVTGHDPSWQ